jgi:hypothetical protein
MPSPLKFPSFDDPSDGTADNPSKLQTIERLDQVFVPLSAVSRDVRRLRIPEVLSATINSSNKQGAGEIIKTTVRINEMNGN